ncbi:MAG: RNA methyltransferase [Oscillospiraceae bacterium]|nr:RNA methyltransferase [Oscillospiraceae bacterium]
MERISSRRNPLCAHFKKLGASRSYREACGEFLCDGIKLLEEAWRCGADIVAVIVSADLAFPLPPDTKVFVADKSLIDSLSPLKSAQNVLFSCKIPENRIRSGPAGTRILLDGVQDPGNVGAIIRTANAFGIHEVILTGDCADIYNPKTIRATMGAIFRQRICCMGIPELLRIKEGGVKFVGAALGEDSIELGELCLKGALIAVGSEGRGISDAVLELCDSKVMIPIDPQCESLNAAVAAAIMMWSVR